MKPPLHQYNNHREFAYISATTGSIHSRQHHAAYPGHHRIQSTVNPCKLTDIPADDPGILLMASTP
ncbi:hypothetical protein ACU4GD_14385 [Cupriavidus basilensis]